MLLVMRPRYAWVLGEDVLRATPPPGAPKVDLLAWTRRMYVRLLRVEVPMFLLLAVFAITTPWIWLIVIGLAAMWLVGFALVNVELRRERRNSR